jgi:ketosteroid isomerase-like protein
LWPIIGCAGGGILRTLEDRIRALEDEREITRTLLQYVHEIDQGEDPAAFGDCFTDDGIWWASIDGPFAGLGGSRHEGRTDIEHWFSGMPRLKKEAAGAQTTPRGKSKHYLISPDIQVDGDRATAESYHLETTADQIGPLITSMGRYLDVLVRCPDGRWRIAERHLCREGAGVDAQKRSTR